MDSLTASIKHHPQKLYTLMEESPPPVPPKDSRYTTTMNAERPSSAHASASKRKRDALDVTSYDENGEDEYTPKRRRSPIPQSDIEFDTSDETTPAYQKNLRRKKGSRNLSNLNLRHAAEKQKALSAKVKSRKSRFVEGSMNDKPSEKPPSMFMRFIRTESGNIRQVAAATEDLMEDYHDEMDKPRDSVEKVIAQEKAAIPSRVADIEHEKENYGGGMFGRWASSFHPVALWNKVFSQTRDEMIREEFEAAERKTREEEAERKAREKAEIEAQYAQMKAAGMFKPKYLGPVVGSVSSRKTVHTQRDSGIVIDEVASVRESQEHGPEKEASQEIEQQEQEYSRAASGMSGLLVPLQPQDDTTSASDVPETASKPEKTLKSRLHLKKPSLTNISGSLKRAKSDFNLTRTLHHRESSSSISPIKMDLEKSMLKKSPSKHDLKKQNKLSKRVSDLESKLSQARRELDEALVDASPMPKLGNKYERFTPQSTLKRPKFMPGKLPSLPSERILMELQARENEMKINKVKAKQDAEMNDAHEDDTRDADLKEFLAEAEVSYNPGDDEGEGGDEETIKARAPHNRRSYPTRASSLFSLNNNNIEQPHTQPAQPTESIQQPDTTLGTETTERVNVSSDLAEAPTSQVDEMDPNSIINFTSNGMVDTAAKPDYAALDAKLKALEANAKSKAKTQRPPTKAKTKKRKSGADEADKEYKPSKGAESEDSAWEEEQTPKKKRKSLTGLATSPNSKSTSKVSPKNKKSETSSSKKKNTKMTEVIETMQVEEYSADEGANEGNSAGDGDVEMPSTRSSVDSLQMRPLEPVLEEADEEEEEIAGDTTTTSIPIKDEPSKPTAKATPARHSALNGRRSRSVSPNKRLAPGAEEQMITRAAEAARNNPARSRASSRSISPIPSAMAAKGINGHHTSAEADMDDEPLRLVPGQGGVPAMPKSKKEGKGGPGKDGEFEWPDDVF